MLSLIVVLLVASLAAGFLQISSQLVGNRKASSDKRASFYMAEAGLAEAYVGLTIGKTGNVGSASAPARFGNGLFWVEATDLEDNLVRLEANGRVGTGVAVLSLVAERGERNVASLGMFSGGAVEVPPGSLIDGWDSRQGSYESQAQLGVNDLGRLGSNAGITVSGTAKQPSQVLGDAFPGPSDVVHTEGQVLITGATGSSSGTQELPSLAVPPLEIGPSLIQGSVTPYVLPAGEWNFQSVTVKSGSDMILQGPAAIVAERITLEPDAHLTFDTTGGEISLLATAGLEFVNGSLVSTPTKATDQVVIQVSGPTSRPVRLEATSSFHGVVYAPEAEVILSGSFEVFGALTAGGLQFTGPVRMHFDRYLEDVTLQAALPSLLSWRILELEAEPRRLNDPFELLGLDPAVCPAPADAHTDQTLHVTYKDDTDTTLTYDGPESAFDWTDVKDVVELSRDGEDVVVLVDVKSVDMVRTAQLLDYLGLTGTVSSVDLQNALTSASPLPDKVIYYAINEPGLDGAHLTSVLTLNAPLGDVLFEPLLRRDPPLASDQLTQVLVQSSPLPPAVLAEIQSGDYLTAGDLADVLSNQ